MTEGAARSEASRAMLEDGRSAAVPPASLPRWIARYAKVSPAAGAYLVCRCLGFPWLAALERCVPPAGRILDLGCGYGLFAIVCGARAAARRVLGIDLLEDRLAVGREVLRRWGGGTSVDLVRADLNDLPPGRFDVICFAHVLMYRPLPEQRALLARCRDRLAPGGRLLVVETVRSPAWKARLSRLQETIVIGARMRLSGARAWPSSGSSETALWDAADLEAYLGSLGLSVESRRMDRYSHLSHRLFIGVAGRERPE